MKAKVRCFASSLLLGGMLVSSLLGAQLYAEQPRSETVKPDAETNRLEPVSVWGDRYKPESLDLAPFVLRFLGVGIPPPEAPDGTLGPYVVTASRTTALPQHVSVRTEVLNAGELQTTPTVTLDAALRSEPGFSLFRRGDSLTTNPTAQGVSLRGVGPSGASRSLVLLDGVPLNDPFGGWVAWSKISRDSLARVEIVPGGGATAWGDAALGGVVQLLSFPPRTALVVMDRPPAPLTWAARGTATFSAFAGDFGTRDASFTVNRPTGLGVLQLSGEAFTTGGYVLVAPERRGPVDVAAWSRHRTFTAKWRQRIGTDTGLTAMVRGFEEFRGNGTPYQQNQSREQFASVKIDHTPDKGFSWNGVAYAQRQSFASTFSSVNPARTAETPANDQFAVPATALGFAWTGTWPHTAGGQTVAGADARAVNGETREDYSFSKGAFTRERVAGGSQTSTGLFVLDQRPIAKAWRANAGLRLDRWDDANGHRVETDRATHAVTRDDVYPDQDGLELSPSAGLVWARPGGWRWRANGQESFRRPTLNELYRPFRQGANVVEANPNLRTEHATTAEIGIDRTVEHDVEHARRTGEGEMQMSREKATWLTFGATAFATELRDAVSNVTLAHGPGTFPLFGTLPAGGVGRQRLNLDRVVVRGVELSATWSPTTTLSVKAGYLYDDTNVRRASVAPTLVGKQLAEVPRQSATLAATWHAPAQLTLMPRLRWIGRQFDDDENTLRLGEAVVADFGVTRPITKAIEVFVNVENIGNARVETARSPDGVVNVGSPRFLILGFRGHW